MFERELRDLAHVPRFVMVRVLRRQNVAEHSFYTAIYADAIARVCDDSVVNISNVVHAALWHDAEECFTGDIPGPTKRDLKGPDWDVKVSSGMEKRFGQFWYCYLNDDEKVVLKVAGLLDEVLYLAGELQMGNSSAGRVFKYCQDRLGTVWKSLPMDSSTKLKLWGVVAKALGEEMAGYSYLQSNSDDITPVPTPISHQRRRGRKPEVFLPRPFKLTEAERKWTSEHALPGCDIDRELEKFELYHVKKDNLMRDWSAAWRAWVINTHRYGEDKDGKAKPASRSDDDGWAGEPDTM